MRWNICLCSSRPGRDFCYAKDNQIHALSLIIGGVYLGCSDCTKSKSGCGPAFLVHCLNMNFGDRADWPACRLATVGMQPIRRPILHILLHRRPPNSSQGPRKGCYDEIHPCCTLILFPPHRNVYWWPRQPVIRFPGSHVCNPLATFRPRIKSNKSLIRISRHKVMRLQGKGAVSPLQTGILVDNHAETPPKFRLRLPVSLLRGRKLLLGCSPCNYRAFIA